MDDRERLRAKMLANAAEINRLNGRIHETLKRRGESEARRQEWSRACEEFHTNYNKLCIPGGWDAGFLDRILAGDPPTIEVALCFLEVRPYFFRSGYHWKTILQKCKRAPMSGQQAQRFAALLGKYAEWKLLRRQSSTRGAAIRDELWPLLRHFHGLFPVRLPDAKFDGLLTVGDLYSVLCGALKLAPLAGPTAQTGTVRTPQRPSLKEDMSAWSREYNAWRQFPWTPEDVWATLVSIIVDVYQLRDSLVVTPETALPRRAN